jgi:cyclopropane fatty-acyl-phospholipid synthase-like methyltransferase
MKIQKVQQIKSYQNQRVTTTKDELDEARVRKENLLLKNACLKKKERLLELQIAIAERNLRKHQL